MRDILDIERALVAAVFTAPEMLPIAGGMVDRSDFLDKDMGGIFESLYLLNDAGQPTTDARLLRVTLKARGVSEEFQSVASLARLIGEGYPHHATYYASRIQNAAMVRKQLAILDRARERLSEESASAADVAAWLEPQIAATVNRHESSTRQISDVVSAFIADLKASQDKPAGGVLTGIYSFDRTMGRFKGGESIVIAARTGIGKSAFAAQIAVNNALGGKHVWFASYEMSHEELVQRMLCAKSRVDSRQVRSGQVSATDIAALEKAGEGLKGLDFGIWKRPFANLRHLRSEAKLINGRKPIDLIVVDYIGLVESEERGRQRHEQVAATSRGLKLLAGELDIPILVLCQLNRDAVQGTPTLAQLRDSGAIEQDADMVIFLHHETPTNQTHKPYEVQVIVAKNRHGPRGSVHLVFDPVTTSFTDPSEPKPEQAFNAFNNRQRTEADSEF